MIPAPPGTIGVSDYAAKHHDPATSNRGTLFLGKDAEGNCDWPLLIKEIRDNWSQQKSGYRDGVILVPVPTVLWDDHGPGEDGTAINLFTCPIANLREGDVFTGAFERRRPTETPRKRVGVVRQSMPYAAFVDVVLYRGDVLDEDVNNPRATDCDWEIVTLLGKLTDEDQPMPPSTLMANHFLADGGTDTKMSPEEFIAALRHSFEFWSGKAIVEVQP